MRKTSKLQKKEWRRRKKCLIKLKSWEKIKEIFMIIWKILLNLLMKEMKLLKISLWISILKITSLKMLLSLLRLEMNQCEMFFNSKIFKIMNLKKMLLIKILKARLNYARLILLTSSIKMLKMLSILTKLKINNSIDWQMFVLILIC